MHSTLKPRTNHDWSRKNLALIFSLTLFAFLIMGYHPGLEDDAFYLAAIKRDLNPALFPHDSQFFTIQFQATIFDKLIALSTRLTHLPLAWITLLWQLAAIFFILHGTFRIARRCFAEPSAQWSAVTMIAALLTLPVSGTAINLADQYLHPRNLATAAILAAIVAVLDSQNNGSQNNHSQNHRHLWLAAILLAIAFVIHAIMAAFGISFCLFLYLTLHTSASKRLSSGPLASLFLFPLGWIFEPTSDAWRKAASTRGFYYLSNWQWYEWLGVFAPLALLYIFRAWLVRHSTGKGTTSVAPKADQRSFGALAAEGSELLSFVSSLLYYGAFQTVIGLAIMLPPSLERLRPFEPMRYLHLFYLLFFLLVGALLGRYVLSSIDLRHPERSRFSGEARDLARIATMPDHARIRAYPYRWVLLFIPLSACMFYAQHQMYPATPHVEWPGAEPRNSWFEAFAWIRENTPVDAYFALDPHYMQLPGEDYHGFRALAERSVLADYDKDGGMAARVPRLAPRWLKEVTAQTGWRDFEYEDFQRLKNEFGVNWIVLSSADRLGSNGKLGSNDQIPNAKMTCPYENRQLRVCRLY
jgi:hypothetical protein